MKFVAIFTDKENARFAHRHLMSRDTLFKFRDVVLVNDTSVVGNTNIQAVSDLKYEFKRCGVSMEQFHLYVKSDEYGAIVVTHVPNVICENSVILGLLT